MWGATMVPEFDMKKVTMTFLLHMPGKELRFPGLFLLRGMFHEFAIPAGIAGITPIVCQIDNAMFNSCLPDEMSFDRGLRGGRIADGQPECDFVREFRTRPDSSLEGRGV